MTSANGDPGAAPRSEHAHAARLAHEARTLVRQLEAAVVETSTLARETLGDRPYLTLAGAVGVGYVLGARAPSLLHRLTSAAGRQLLVTVLARQLIAGAATPDA